MRLKTALVLIAVLVVLALGTFLALQALDKSPPARTTASGTSVIVDIEEAAPELEAGRAMGADCPSCPEMVFISAGSFVIGLDREEAEAAQVPLNRRASERPRRGMTLSGNFAISATEITRAGFSRFVEQTGHQATGCTVFNGYAWVTDPDRSWRDPGFEQGEDTPVVCVSFEDAVAYADWLSSKTGRRYTLPSESQWEYAARARDIATPPWQQWSGENPMICSSANIADLDFQAAYPSRPRTSVAACEDGFVHTAPVKRFPPNAFGLFGMIANVREIVADCYAPSLRDRPMGGAALQIRGCEKRIVRGGGWWDGIYGARAGHRAPVAPALRRADTGFRVVKELSNLSTER